MINRILYNIICITFFTSLIYAQPETKQNNNFKYINFGIDGFNCNGIDDLAKYWKAGQGVDVFLSTNYGWIDVRAGIKHHLFTNLNSSVQSFTNTYYYFQFEKDLPFSENIRPFGGISFGMSSMDFGNFSGETELDNALLIEREFTYGASGGFKLFFEEHLVLKFETGFMNIMTNNELFITVTQFGMAFRFDTPKWLRDILK